MAKKKNLFKILLGETEVEVPQGDMSDEEYAAAYNAALENGTAVGSEEYKKAKAAEPVEQEATPQSGQDFMEVKAGDGKTVKVYRGPLDDTTWSQSIERAKKTGTLVSSVESSPTEPPLKRPLAVAKTADGRDVSVPSNMTGEETAATNEAVKKLSSEPEKAGGSKGSIVKRMADSLFSGATKAQTAEELVESIKLPSTPGKPAGKMQSMLSKEMSEDVRQPVPMEPPLPNRGPDEPTYEQPPGFLDQVKTGVGEAINSAEAFRSRVMSPEPLTPEGRATMAGYAQLAPPQAPPIGTATNAQLAPLREAAPTRAGENAIAGAAQAAPAVGGSMGASVKTSSSGPGATNIPPMMPSREGTINDAYAAADKARMDRANVEAAGMKEQARIVTEGRDAMNAARVEEMAQQERIQGDIEAGQVAVRKILSDATEPAKVDPNRWWNSRSTAQKIFAVLSAGLTKGATLQQFQHAIDTDIDAQKADIDNLRAHKRDQLSGAMNIVQMARQNKLDLYEQQKVARVFAWDQIERSAKAAALNTSSDVAKANATEISTIAGMQKQKELADYDRHREMGALEREKLAASIRHQRSMEGAAWTRARSEKQGQPLRGPQVDKVRDLKDALMTAKNYSKEFKEKAGGLIDKLGKHVPGTDASDFDAKRDAIIQLVGKALEGGVLREGDIPRYQRMIPEAGDLRGAVKFDTLIKELTMRLKDSVRGYGAANFDTGTLTQFTDEAMTDDDQGFGVGYEAD